MGTTIDKALSLLATFSTALWGCASEPEPLDWRLTFASSDLEERATLVEAQIRRGSCESTELVYESRFDVGESPTTPPALEDGRYAFSARVRDAECRWYASGCAERRLPLDGDSVVLELRPGAAPELDCEGCDSPRCAGDAAPPMDVASEPPPLVPVTIRIEAEAANILLPPLAAYDDENASGGVYMSYLYDPALPEPITMFKRSDPPVDGADGIARYDFAIDLEGDYRLWARVLTPTLDEDSFWFKVDSGEWILWNDVAHDVNYQWVDVRDFNRRSQVLVFPLTEGDHTLTVSYRELNAKLDVVLLTNDLSLVPAEP